MLAAIRHAQLLAKQLLEARVPTATANWRHPVSNGSLNAGVGVSLPLRPWRPWRATSPSGLTPGPQRRPRGARGRPLKGRTEARNRGGKPQKGTRGRQRGWRAGPQEGTKGARQEGRQRRCLGRSQGSRGLALPAVAQPGRYGRRRGTSGILSHRRPPRGQGPRTCRARDREPRLKTFR